MAKVPPKLGEVATKGAVVAGALASLALAPGSMLVSGVAALVGGGLTRLTVAPLLVEGRYKSLQYKVATLLEEAVATEGDFGAASREEIAQIVESWGLPKDYTVAVLSQIYVRYVLELLKLAEVKLSETNRLVKLREMLGLDDEAVGDAHYEAAIDVYREVQWTPTAVLEDAESYEHKRVSKLFFTCRSVLASSGRATEEAIEYEMARLRSIFAMDPDEMESRCDAVAGKFYDEALAGVAASPELVGPDLLRKTRAKLGLSPDVALRKHLALYRSEVDRLLEERADVLSDEDVDRLGALATALEMNEETAVVAGREACRPRFRAICVATAVDDMSEGMVTPVEAAELLIEARRKMRLMPSEVAAEALCDCLASQFQVVVSDAVQAAGGATREEAAGFIRRVLVYKDAVDTVLEAFSATEFGVGTEAGDWLVGDYKAEIKGTMRRVAADLDRALIYEVALRSNVEDDWTEEVDLRALRDLLGLPERSFDELYAALVEPRLEGLVAPMIRDNAYDAEALATFLEHTALPDHRFKDFAIRKFDEKHGAVYAAADDGVVTPEARAEIDDLVAFLRLEPDDVMPIVRDRVLPTYKKAIKEAMASSPAGIVIDEYKAGLEALRDRIALDEIGAAEALRDAAAETMEPLFARLAKAFAETSMTRAQLGDKGEDDRGEDLFVSADGGDLGILPGSNRATQGLGGVLRHLNNVVDFYEGNGLGENGPVVASSVAYASADINEMQRYDIYKKAFTAFLTTKDRDPEVHARLRAALFKSPAVLNFDDDRAAALRTEVGMELATNYCKHSLATKGSLDASDAAFVDKLAAELEVELENVPLEAKKRILVDRFRLVRTTGHLATDAANIAEVRDAAIAMGIDVGQELGISYDDREAYFSVEVRHLIANEIEAQTGPTKVDSTDAVVETIADLIETYHVQDEIQQKLGKIGAEFADKYLIDSMYALGSDIETTLLLNKLIATAKVVGPDDLRAAMALDYLEDKRNPKLINVYAKSRTHDPERLEVLKIVIEPRPQPTEEEASS
mmetsp:Transcript_6593/g.20050  ORF Transcript_6593/g.20050 Transcript_6593/m.20050 type:complete len:1029 (+) Transcript_6593:400-3486(+)